jgi:hypothetical protein
MCIGMTARCQPRHHLAHRQLWLPCSGASRAPPYHGEGPRYWQRKYVACWAACRQRVRVCTGTLLDNMTGVTINANHSIADPRAGMMMLANLGPYAQLNAHQTQLSRPSPKESDCIVIGELCNAFKDGGGHVSSSVGADDINTSACQVLAPSSKMRVSL